VLRLLDLVANALRAMKDGADPRTQLELALVKAARPEHDPTLRALMARLERLEQGRPAPASAAPVHRPEVPATAAARAAAPAPPQPVAPRADAPPDREAPPYGEPARPSPPPYGEPPQAAEPEAPAVVAVSADVDGAPPVTAVAVVDPDGTVSKPDVRVGVSLDLGHIAELWPAVLADLQESPVLYHALENARPSSLQDGELTLTWAESAAFSKRKAEDPACREQIAAAIRTVTGSSLKLAYALADDAAHEEATTAPALSEDELIDAFMREFDAEELPAEEESS
jgi:DNA polymerase-3 subunit gamma/tau